MSGPDPWRYPDCGALPAVGLLERSVGYALGGLALVTPADLSRRSPCAAWDLRALLRHLDDSLRVLAQAVTAGHLDLDAPGQHGAGAGDHSDKRRVDPLDDPVPALRRLAGRTVGAWVAPSTPRTVSVADCSLPAEVVAATGAVEVVVHGWDVWRTCGIDRPVPAALATRLLDLCGVVVDAGDRPHRFAPPVAVPPNAPPGDRLVALLGRDPSRGRPGGLH